MYLRVPLSKSKVTFFLALTKDEGSMTEKAMRKTSVPGYAKGLNLPNYYWPAVSLDEGKKYHNPKLIILLSILRTVVKLSKMVGSYDLGNLF